MLLIWRKSENELENAVSFPSDQFRCIYVIYVYMKYFLVFLWTEL